MTTATSGDVVRSGSTELQWHPAARLALLRFTADTSLTGNHGAVLVDSLRGWGDASDGAEMFRTVIRRQLKTFADEAAARYWLRTQGIAA